MAAASAPPPSERQPSDGPDAPREVLQGTVELVTFHSKETLYSVLKIQPEKGYEDPDPFSGDLFGARVAAVGLLPDAMEGLRLRLLGHWSTSRKHGRQFEFESAAILPPGDTEGLVRYLSSRAFPGVGEVLARRIVQQLGERTLERIRDEPDALAGVSGLRPHVRAELVERVRSELAAHRSRAFLHGLGLGPRQVEAVLAKHGADCEALLRENPYRLSSGIAGIGFQIADRAALRLGMAKDSMERARAGLVFAQAEAESNGHTCLPREELLRQAERLLRGEMPAANLERGLDELVAGRELVQDTDARFGARLVYSPMLHGCESALARNLARQVGTDGGRARPLATAAELADAERRLEIELHPLQRDAVFGLLSSRVALLTGGPGVGKTTIVRLVVQLAEGAGAKVALASPTGRAAKRLAEATGREAKTIHRLLGYDPIAQGFTHDDKKPLAFDLVVIDELSMLDVLLAHQLVKAIGPDARVVFVGDPDQLPSVMAGSVLADLLASERIPTWRLTRIYRQDAHSLIVENAHRILQGELPVLPERGAAQSDFYMFPVEDEAAAADRVVEVVTERIPQRFGMAWLDDVQVLAPMYRGECGVDNLNERLRAVGDHRGESVGASGREFAGGFGRAAREIELRGRTWRVGDRVIQTRNDYERLVFNGDMGRVSRIATETDGLFVQFPEQEVLYEPEDLSDLQLAFAITVHRSQGGEFPAVVIPLVPQHYMMLQRHLLYTAITRAKKLVVLVGSQRALKMAVDNAEQRLRESALCDRLRALLRANGSAATR
ncbi:MAG: ATP-dependent RecD-like DNA helicase [Planctomycetota bacterium]|nr:MAG: ATP-dependent RecD-like DNA helicase [Planctomycetota bacterium]